MPVVVYQMGKVGSTSVLLSLKRHGVAPLYKVHFMNPENFGDSPAIRRGGSEPVHIVTGRKVYREIVVPRKRAKFITLVRDPVATNVSGFLQVFEQLAGRSLAESGYSLEELGEFFLREYPHHLPLTWMETEVGRILGIDVYAEPFDRARGHVRLGSGAQELLVLRCELDDAVKQAALAGFLGLGSFKITRANVGAEKDYASVYGRFRESVRLPDSYLEWMYTSRYARHFYAPREIERFRAYWTDAGRTVKVPAAPAAWKSVT